MKSAAYRMHVDQGSGYRVVCSICRKTQTVVHRVGKETIVLNDSIASESQFLRRVHSVIGHRLTVGAFGDQPLR
jgi:hypothetical protein